MRTYMIILAVIFGIFAAISFFILVAGLKLFKLPIEGVELAAVSTFLCMFLSVLFGTISTVSRKDSQKEVKER